MTENERLKARIDALERRHTRTWVLLIVGLFAIALIGAKKRTPPVVDAKAFVLVDDAGKSRAQLALADDGNVSLLLTAANGTANAGMTVLQDGSVALRLKNQKRSSTWELSSDGNARVRFNQMHSKAAVEIGIDAAGRPRVVLNDGFGKVVHKAP